MIDESKTALEKVAELEFEIQQHSAEMVENLLSPRKALAFRSAAHRARKLAKNISSWIYEEAFRKAYEAHDEEAYTNPQLLRDRYGKSLKYTEYVDQKIRGYEV